MACVEIDIIVTNSVEALALYETIFEVAVRRVEVTSLPMGQNEAVFTLYGTRFHLLDANEAYGMVPATPGAPKPLWVNVVVPEIAPVFARAIKAGCRVISPVTEMPEMGVVNAMVEDGFGVTWMLHEKRRVVSFEDRTKHFEALAKGEQRSAQS